MPSAVQKEIVYPEPRIRVFTNSQPERPEGLGDRWWPYGPALTMQKVKGLLRWETEDEYIARCLKGNDKLKPADLAAGFGELLLRNVVVKDGKPKLNGDKVRCGYNAHNRHFREQWALQLAQDILSKHWLLNYENIIISLYGNVVSGQHRMIGFVLACEMWEQDEHWRQFWPEMPTLETSIATGVPESQELIDTLDNTLKRTLGDVIFTDAERVFAGWKVKEKQKDRVVERLLNSREKDEVSRFLATATDLLWERTGAGSSHHEFKTHSEMKAFQNRHPKLLACVKHIFEENQDRAINNLKLYAGHCAACMYLMASAKSKPDDYRSLEPAPAEAALTFDLWDKASQFWVDLAAGRLKGVTDALAKLVDPDTLQATGRAIEKLCILGKAWNLYALDKKPTEELVTLRYITNKLTGEVSLHDDDWVGFGGIDLGPKKQQSDGNVSEAEATATKKKLSPEESAKVKAGQRAALAEEAHRKLAEAKAEAARKTAGNKTAAPTPKPSPAPAAAAQRTAPVPKRPTTPKAVYAEDAMKGKPIPSKGLARMS